MKIIENIRSKLRSAVQRVGFSFSSATSVSELLKTIDMLKPQITPSIELIRVGAKGDGGYIVPNDFENVSFCFSPGVDQTASFELDLVKYGIKSYLADFSVEKPPSYIDDRYFTRKYVGIKSDKYFMTLQDWIREAIGSDDSDLILQMDIEGDELQVILDAPMHVLSRFRIIVIELHSLQSLANRDFNRIYKAFIEKLTMNHRVVHLHPNNVIRPCYVRSVEVHPIIEVTLLRKDRFNDLEKLTSPEIPNPLDTPNLSKSKDVPLNNAWYE